MGSTSPSVTEPLGSHNWRGKLRLSTGLVSAALIAASVSCSGSISSDQTSAPSKSVESSTTSRPSATVTVPAIFGVPTPTISDSHRRSVALVRITVCDGSGTGSGFFVTPTLLITNQHVVEDATSVKVQTSDGTVLDVLKIERHATADLARVTVGPSTSTTVAIDASELVSGDDVYVVGFPRGRPLTMTGGRLVEYGPAPTGERVLHISALVEPGNSGGPVFNNAGGVVGIATAIELRTGIAIAIPAAELTEGRARWTPEPITLC